MGNKPTQKRNALLPLGIVFMVLGITVFKEASTPKFIMLGASILMLGYSAYLNLMNKSKE